MKMNVCDICRNEEGKIVEGDWRISIKNKTTRTRFALDACEKHKGWLKGKTMEQATSDFAKLDAHLKNVPSATLVTMDDLKKSKPKKCKCKYCGKATKSIDKDVLCEECQETFGHAFYSEL